MAFELGEKGLALIKSREGCKLKAYTCQAGVWTIGYGHTGDVKPGQTITQKQAEELFKKDLKKYVNAVNKLVKVSLTQNQFDALVSFTYNVGIGAFQNSTLLRKLNAKDYAGASNEFARWNKAGGTVSNGLIARRKEEKALFLNKSSARKKEAKLVSKLKPINRTSPLKDIKVDKGVLKNKVIKVKPIIGTAPLIDASLKKGALKSKVIKVKPIIGKSFVQIVRPESVPMKAGRLIAPTISIMNGNAQYRICISKVYAEADDMKVFGKTIDRLGQRVNEIKNNLAFKGEVKSDVQQQMKKLITAMQKEESGMKKMSALLLDVTEKYQKTESKVEKKVRAVKF